jgi:protein-tyrosine kinase
MGAQESSRSLIERAAQRISSAFSLEPERPEEKQPEKSPEDGDVTKADAAVAPVPQSPPTPTETSAAEPSPAEPPAAQMPEAGPVTLPPAPEAEPVRPPFRPEIIASVPRGAPSPEQAAPAAPESPAQQAVPFRQLQPHAQPAASEVRPARERRRSQSAMIDLDRLRQGGFIVPDDAPTRVAEEFRIVKRQLLRKALPSSPDLIPNGNLLMVTSTQPGEGKTFCSINLALSIASERDLTVMLVDADVARPQLLSALDIEADKGLIDVLVDDRLDVADCLLRTNIDNLTVLPAGRPHPGATELLSSDKMAALLQEMARRYHDRIVIFDSSPVLASSAPGVLAARMGQILFVVEADRTRETQVMEALSLISDCRNISMLLNKSRFMGGKVRFGSYYEYYRS